MAAPINMRSKKPPPSPASPRADEKIPKDFFLDLGKEIDVILSMPAVDPFTGKPMELPTRTSNRKSKVQRRMSKKSLVSRVSPLQQFAAAPANDFGGGLMAPFGISRVASAPSPTTEELAAQWAKELKPADREQGPSSTTPSPQSFVGKPERASGTPPSPPETSPESLGHASFAPLARGRRGGRQYPTTSVDEPAVLTPPPPVPPLSLQESPPPPRATTNAKEVNESAVAEESPGLLTKPPPKLRAKSFVPPVSSRAAVKPLAEEETVSLSPQEAGSVEEAVDRLREYFVERFGTPQKAFAALQKAGRSTPSKGDVRCAGVLTTRELRNAMHKLGVNWPQISGCGNIHKILRTFDCNGNGNLGFEELMGDLDELSTSSSSSDEDEMRKKGDEDDEDWEEEADNERSARQRRALEEERHQAELRRRPRWNTRNIEYRSAKNVVGRDLLLRSDRVHHSRFEHGEPPIWRRYETKRKEKAKAIRAEQDKREAEELDQCTFQPKTFTEQYDQGRQQVRITDADQQRWSPRRERDAATYHSTQPVGQRFKPQICERSTTIYRTLRDGDEVDWHERLSNEAQHKRMTKKNHIPNQELVFQPRVSERSRRLKRPGEVHSRLFHQGSEATAPMAAPGEKSHVTFTADLGDLLRIWEKQAASDDKPAHARRSLSRMSGGANEKDSEHDVLDQVHTAVTERFNPDNSIPADLDEPPSRTLSDSTPTSSRVESSTTNQSSSVSHPANHDNHQDDDDDADHDDA